MQRKHSVRLYYFTTMLTVLFVGVIIICVSQFLLSAHYYSNKKEDRLRRQVVTLSEEIRTNKNLSLDDLDTMVEYLFDIDRNNTFILNSEGKVLVAYQSNFAEIGSQFPSVALEKARDGVFSEYSTLDHTFFYKNFIAGTCVTSASTGEDYYLFVLTDGKQMNDFIKNGVVSLTISSIMVLIIAALLNIVIFKRMLKPIEEISKVANEFSLGHYDVRQPVKGDDEFSRLAIGFNNMADSLQAIDETRQSFMGSFAHELRTPMTAIQGFIDGLLDGTIPEDQQSKYLKIVSEEVSRLSRLIQRMLDISKLEAGEYDFDYTIFNIYDPIIAVILGAEQRIESKNIEIKWAQEIEPQLVKADKDFLQEVIFNLLDNAIKFTNEGGDIIFSVERVDTQVKVSIKNTGLGISQQDIVHIFDRFYKEDESRGRNKNGTGLGLHICRIYINGMGGRIWADSKEGEWFEISFMLPAGLD